MKRLKIIAVLLVCIICCAALAACSPHGAPDYTATNSGVIAGLSEQADGELNSFIKECPDRTTYTQKEQNAAMYIYKRLQDLGFAEENVKIQEFTATENKVGDLQSQNVIAKVKTADNAKNVIIGAYYDNRTNQAYANATALGGEGALAGGTGVATLLTLAKYFNDNRSAANGLNITFVFFGASYLHETGADEYYAAMTETEFSSTVLMVELQRLSCDHVYAFCDERKTERQQLIRDVARKNSLDIFTPTSKSPQVLTVSALNGIPYTRWAHTGVFSVFFNAGIPTLNLIGGNWETVNMGDIESAGERNISFTQDDTLENLRARTPDYAQKMATAATLVIKSIGEPDFAAAMTNDREYFPSTDYLTDSWIWLVIVLAVVLIAAGIMSFIAMRLEKKYPIVRPAPKTVKMAVFGMDYEDGNSADIFVDFADPSNEIFPGIPNNSNKPVRGIDDIFPPYVPPQARQNAEQPKAQTPPETEKEQQKEQITTEQPGEPKQEQPKEQITTEQPEEQETTEPPQAVVPPEPKQAEAEQPKPTKPKAKTTSGKKSTKPKAKTTSGKKSTKPKSKSNSDDN